MRIIAFIILSLTSLAFAQQPNDPYASDYAKTRVASYERFRNASLGTIQRFYFAYGCKVFSAEGEFLPVIYDIASLIREEGLKDRVYVDSKLDEFIGSSAKRGMESAAKSCNYWHENPQKVYEMRQLADESMRNMTRRATGHD